LRQRSGVRLVLGLDEQAGGLPYRRAEALVYIAQSDRFVVAGAGEINCILAGSAPTPSSPTATRGRPAGSKTRSPADTSAWARDRGAQGFRRSAAGHSTEPVCPDLGRDALGHAQRITETGSFKVEVAFQQVELFDHVRKVVAAAKGIAGELSAPDQQLVPARMPCKMLRLAVRAGQDALGVGS
jgi:hypothetical protein